VTSPPYPTAPPIPVTVIGGYLGAGKTTLVNELLAGDHGRRLAVLVNDFGEVNIDAALIEAHEGGTVSLANGCVCCSIQDSLGDALDQVLALEPPPDQILIEASGIADPGKVANYGRGWPGCRLDAVVVLVDAETIRARAADQFVGELVVRQLSTADLLVITKTDLVTTEVQNDVTAWVRSRVGDEVAVLHASRGRIDPAVVLDVGAPTAARTEGAAHGDGAGLFDTRLVRFERPVPRLHLERALADWSDDVVRVKGAVDVENEGPRLVQRVGRRWSIEPTDQRTLEQIAGDAAGLLVLIRYASEPPI
jgi:G3E family GTPase